MWLQPGAASSDVQQRVRTLATREGLDGALLEFANSGEIRTMSLRIFDRSSAVTYWLQAVAVAIGLFGIAASFCPGARTPQRIRALLGLLPAWCS